MVQWRVSVVVNSRQRLHVIQRNSNMNWCFQVAVGDKKNEQSACDCSLELMRSFGRNSLAFSRLTFDV